MKTDKKGRSGKKQLITAAVKLALAAVVFCGLFAACGIWAASGNTGSVNSPAATVSLTVQADAQKQGKLAEPVKGQLKIHFIDVGQADSILVQTPGGKTMLIDAGNNPDGINVVSYLKKQGVSKIDIIIGTHPHEDHIGGIDTVINSFDAGTIYMPKVSSNTKTFEDVLTAAENKGLKITTAFGGNTLELDPELKVEMLAPNAYKYEEINNYSAVCKVSYGNTAFLFDGDAEEISEKEMINRGYNLNADVLKIGHHGSCSSTSDEFLNKVSPKYAVISVGKSRDYGHPNKLTMEKLRNKGIPVYRTDQCGTVIAVSDGKNISFNSAPGDYSYRGE